MTDPTRQTHSERSRIVGIGALLILITIGVYWPVHRHDFINFDDPDYVTGNPRVQAGLTLETARWAFTQAHSSNWHPLTWLSHALDCQWFGLNPGGHHLMSAGFHAINALLVFLLLRQLTGSIWRSALAAALFALHPLHVESVAWVSERKDVLSAFFGLLTLMAYVKYVSGATQQRAGNSHHAWRWYAVALVLFALGLMSKPMLVTWPFVMLLLDFWPLKRIPGSRHEGSDDKALHPGLSHRAPVFRRLVFEKLPFLALVVASSVITMLVQRGSGATVPLTALPLDARLAQMPVAYTRYLAKTFWPENLAVFYPYERFALTAPAALGAAVLLLTVTALILSRWRRQPFLVTGWLWFLGTLVPVIGLVQVGRQALADRYTYIPHIGLFLAVVWLAAELAERLKAPRFMRGIAAGLMLAACAILTARQLAHWENTGTLARHTIRATMNNYVAHVQLAGVLAAEGKPDEALAHVHTALQIRPNYAEAHNSLATILARQGRTQEAIASYEAAVRYDATLPDPHHGLADIYQRQGRFAEAERESRLALAIAPMHPGAIFSLAQSLHSQHKLEEAIAAYHQLDALKPGLFTVHYGLGSLHALKGDLTNALQEFESARKLQPTNATVHNSLAVLLLESGRVLEASNHFATAATLEPTNSLAHFQLGNLLNAAHQDAAAAVHYRKAWNAQPDQPELLNNFAWLLATSAQDSVRDGAEAVRLAERACALTQQQMPFLLGTLAAAYAEAGRFDDAIAAATKARDLAREQKLDSVAARNDELLQKYRARQPHREPGP